MRDTRPQCHAVSPTQLHCAEGLGTHWVTVAVSFSLFSFFLSASRLLHVHVHVHDCMYMYVYMYFSFVLGIRQSTVNFADNDTRRGIKKSVLIREVSLYPKSHYMTCTCTCHYYYYYYYYSLFPRWPMANKEDNMIQISPESYKISKISLASKDMMYTCTCTCSFSVLTISFLL